MAKSSPTQVRAPHLLSSDKEVEVDRVLGPVARRYALLVGVNRYDDERWLGKLKYAVKDVKQLEQVLRAYGYQVEALHDENDASKRPTSENVLRELRALVKKAKPEDLVLVHFSCHGKLKNGQPILMLADTRWRKDGFGPVIEVEEVKRVLTAGRSRRLVLMMDACQTGESGREVVDPKDHEAFMRSAYLQGEGLAVLASCSDGQVAREPDALGHGLFTYYVLEGLRKGAVDASTQLVTTSKLATYVRAKLKEWWKKEDVTLQIPELEIKDADLAIADRRQLTAPEALEGPKVRRIEGHTMCIRALALSPDGSRLLTASDDATARLWDAKTGKARGEPFPHPVCVAAVAWSPDGKRIATADDAGTVRVWRADKPAAAEVEVPPGYSMYTCVAFSPDGRHLAMGSSEGAMLLDLVRNEVDLGLGGHDGAPIYAIAFSRDGKLIATAGESGRVILRDARTKEWLRKFDMPQGPSGPIGRLAFSPDGKLLAAAGSDPAKMETLMNVPRIWNVRTGARAFSLEGHADAITAIAFSPDGRRLLTTSADQTARLWDAAQGKCLDVFDEPGKPVTAGAFSADGKGLILGYDDGTLLVLDAPGQAPKVAPRKGR